MPVRIKTLINNVTVRTHRKEISVHADARAPRPSLQYLMPTPEPRDEDAGPSVELGKPRPGTVHAEPVEVLKDESAARVDSHLVADRVYELMLEEIRLTRLRGVVGRFN